MDTAKISVTVQFNGHSRQLDLPREAWPLVVGSGPRCNVPLSEGGLAAENAVFERQGIHTYVTALKGLPVRAHGKVIPVGSSVRADGVPVSVGPYTLDVAF